MARILLFFLVSTWVLSCNTNKEITHEANAEESKRFEVVVKFNSLEDVKRVPFNLPQLKMELVEEVSHSDHIYSTTVLCQEYAIDGVVEKLNLEEGVGWAKRNE